MRFKGADPGWPTIPMKPLTTDASESPAMFNPPAVIEGILRAHYALRSRSAIVAAITGACAR